jgi:hypothetical protein
MTRGFALALSAAILLAACTSSPSPTNAPPTIGPTSEVTPTPVATAPGPSSLIAVSCGPLDPERCQSAVEARVAPLGVAPVAEVAIEPEASLLTCPPSTGPVPTPSVCSVIAVVTFTKPGPLVMGLVLSGDRWTWSGATTGWWGSYGGSYCAAPAAYRVSGRVGGIGSCVGVLFDPGGVTITLAVGQVLDLHMTVARNSPFYPLPWSTSPTVINIEATSDAATATYRALSPGTATLRTIGNCVSNTNTPTASGGEFIGPCPVAEIHVTAVR